MSAEALLEPEAMVTIKVADAPLTVINWLVAKIRKIHDSDIGIYYATGKITVHGRTYEPTSDWATGGPYLLEYGISTFDLPSGINVAEHAHYKPGHLWEAEIMVPDTDSIRYCGFNQLDSGMRCLVEKYYGAEIRVPALLIK